MSNSQAGGTTNRPSYARSNGNKVSKSASFHHTFLTHGAKPRHVIVKSFRTSYHEEESTITSGRRQRNKRTEHRASTFHSLAYEEGYIDNYDRAVGSEMTAEQALRAGVIDRKALKKLSLTKREVKRQENILEFIQGEVGNLALLRIIHQVYIKGLVKELQMDQTTLNKLFPNIEDHIMFASQLADQLKKRQNLSKIISGVGDILVEHFDELNGDNMKRLYGDLCSKENEILVFYREMMKNDKKFCSFIKKCDRSSQSRRQDFCSCLQAVIQRINKTPSLIQNLIDSSDPEDHVEDHKLLEKSLELSQEIMKDVREHVQVYKRGNLLLETHARIEPRSYTTFKGSKKFDRKELLKRNRKLLYSCNVQLNIPDQKRNVEIFLLVLSDCIVFLEENSGKYVFLTGQQAVVPFHKMIVREAAADERGLYLISMSSERIYPLRLPSDEECLSMAKVIKTAIGNCHDDDEGITSEEEEERRLRNRQRDKARQTVTQVELYDRRILKQYEEKMEFIRRLNDAVGRRRIVESLDATDADSDQEIVQNPDDSPTSKKKTLVSKREMRNHRESLAERMHFYIPKESTLSPTKSPAKQFICQPPLLQATEQVNKLTLALHGIRKSPKLSFRPKEHGLLTRPASTLLKRSDTFGGFDNAKPPPRTRYSNSAQSEKLTDFTQDKSESRSLDSISDESNQSPAVNHVTLNNNEQNIIEESSEVTDKYLVPLEQGSQPPTALLTLNQITALVELAQTLSCYQSFATQQDTHIERLKLEIVQERINYKKQLFDIQEAELKRNQVKQQELSDNLKQEQKLFRQEKEDWLIEASKTQEKIYDEKAELEKDNEIMSQERSSILREKKDLETIRSELQRLRQTSPHLYSNGDIDVLLEKVS